MEGVSCKAMLEDRCQTAWGATGLLVIFMPGSMRRCLNMRSPGQSYRGLGAESCVPLPPSAGIVAEAPVYFNQALSQVMLELASSGPAAGSHILGSTTPGNQQNPCSARCLHSRPSMVSSTNTKEAIEGKAVPTRRKPHRRWVPADFSSSPDGSWCHSAALPGAALERAAEDTAMGSHETAMMWNSPSLPPYPTATGRELTTCLHF